MTHSSFTVGSEFWPVAGDGFTISRVSKREEVIVHLSLKRNQYVGQYVGEGEATPLKRYHHLPEQVVAEITDWLEEYPVWSRDLLEQSMKAGPARNAIDNALWRLEAAEHGTSFAKHVGITSTHSLPTAFTLSGARPDIMANHALGRHRFRWLKIKLMGDGLDADRLRAIHKAVPDKELIVDANEGLTEALLEELLPVFLQTRVILIEQPLPEGKDDTLRDWRLPIPLVADESCHTLESLESLRGKYHVVNLKLDKTGGLTHALKMKTAARAMGFQIMVGCMLSTSLGVYPAFLLGQDADYTDLDGALLLERDREFCEKPDLIV
jgi:L-alanine-DL-glutamate epimerase-like enolase superfamily enzyme